MDSIIQATSQVASTLIAAVSTIAAAAISGWFLIRSHHSRVEAEIKLNAEMKLFETKRRLYEELLSQISKQADILRWLRPKKSVPWRKVQEIRYQLMTVGSREVIEAVFGLDKSTKPSVSEQDYTRAFKKVWRAVRNDLYGASSIPEELFPIISPSSKERQTWLELLQYFSILIKGGIEDIEELANANVDTLTTISKTEGAPRLDRLLKFREWGKYQIQQIKELERSNQE